MKYLMSFTFKKLEIPDVILVEPKSLSDDRGFFLESFKESDFASNGIDAVSYTHLTLPTILLV